MFELLLPCDDIMVCRKVFDNASNEALACMAAIGKHQKQGS